VADSFEDTTRQLLRDAREVEIETAAGQGAPRHRTIIWVVVDDGDRVFIRSVRGPVGRWYREVRAEPAVSLLVAGRRIPVQAEQASDPGRVEAASRALRSKYAGSRASLAAMLRDETLPTTLELLPR
jgi:hypothetical protein